MFLFCNSSVLLYFSPVVCDAPLLRPYSQSPEVPFSFHYLGLMKYLVIVINVSQWLFSIDTFISFRPVWPLLTSTTVLSNFTFCRLVFGLIALSFSVVFPPALLSPSLSFSPCVFVSCVLFPFSSFFPFYSSFSLAAYLSLVDQTVKAAKLPEAREGRAALSNLSPSPERKTNADKPISCMETITHHFY